eukprot:5272950-Alexandrium_andersonii.AAC.1
MYALCESSGQSRLGGPAIQPEEAAVPKVRRADQLYLSLSATLQCQAPEMPRFAQHPNGPTRSATMCKHFTCPPA